MINKKPYIDISSEKTICWEGWGKISEEIRKKIVQLDQKKVIVCIESYHGIFADFKLKSTQRSDKTKCHLQNAGHLQGS